MVAQSTASSANHSQPRSSGTTEMVSNAKQWTPDTVKDLLCQISTLIQPLIAAINRLIGVLLRQCHPVDSQPSSTVIVPDQVTASPPSTTNDLALAPANSLLDALNLLNSISAEVAQVVNPILPTTSVRGTQPMVHESQRRQQRYKPRRKIHQLRRPFDPNTFNFDDYAPLNTSDYSEIQSDPENTRHDG